MKERSDLFQWYCDKVYSELRTWFPSYDEMPSPEFMSACFDSGRGPSDTASDWVEFLDTEDYYE